MPWQPMHMATLASMDLAPGAAAGLAAATGAGAAAAAGAEAGAVCAGATVVAQATMRPKTVVNNLFILRAQSGEKSVSINRRLYRGLPRHPSRPVILPTP